MALGIHSLSPNLLPFTTLIKARLRRGGVCLAGPALLCGLALLSAPTKAFSPQRLAEPHGNQSAMLDISERSGEFESSDVPADDVPADDVPADDMQLHETEATDTGWSLFTSDAGKFRISMPSVPAAYTFLPNADLADAQVSGSRMYMQMQLVDATHLEIYAAAFIASTRFTTDSSDVTEALVGCVMGLSDSDPVMPPRAIALGEYPGLEAEFLTAEGSLQVSQCYLAGDRAYLLTATNELFSAGEGLQPVTWGSSVPVRSPAMDAFFSSFEILP